MTPNASMRCDNHTSELAHVGSSSPKQSDVFVSSKSDTHVAKAEADRLATRESKLSLSGSTSRLVNYYTHHGCGATFSRILLFVRRLFSFPRMFLFYRDLTSWDSALITTNCSDDLRVERQINADQIDSRDLQQIVNFWNPGIYRQHVAERFERGASLWTIRSAGRLAGYGWTITGCTVEPHYFPIGPNDVHLFDFLIFPKYRGRRLNPLLVIHILDQMATEGRSRAYIEAAEWNRAQLTSLSKTGFRLFGTARKARFFGRTFVQWGNPEIQPVTETQSCPKA